MSCLGYCPPTSNTHCRRAIPAAAAPLGDVPVRRAALLGRPPLRLGGLAVDLAPFASHADEAAPVPVLDLPPARGGGGPCWRRQSVCPRGRARPCTSCP